MSHLLNDFASIDTASRRRGPGRSNSRWRPVMIAMVCATMMTTSGCSILGYAGKLWPFGGGDKVKLIDGETVSPEDIQASLVTTRANMQLDPQEPYWPFRMGEMYAVLDSTQQAATHLAQALDIDPGYAPAAALLSKLYYDAGMYDEGVILLDKFVYGNGDVPDELRVALALHLDAYGELDRANEVLSACSNGSKFVHTTRTYVTLMGEDPESALEHSQRALETDSKSAVNYSNYGIALLHTGRPFEARDAFKKALKIDEQLAGAMYNMAIVEAFYFFNEDAGREWFERYKEIASDDPDDLATQLATDVSVKSPDK